MTSSQSPKGRPPLFTKERTKLIIEAVKRGLTLKLAAAYAGISYDTLNRWRIKGCEDSDSEFSEFCQSLEQAKAEAALQMVDCITKAATTDWKAAIWLLSRRHPDQFSENAKEEPSSMNRLEIETASLLG
jgi:hypothetical protein